MIKKTCIVLLLCVLFSSLSAQSVIGKWKTIDDETGEAKSIIDIYEQDGKLYGIVVEILNANKKDALCVKCEGSKKDKPILTMIIIDGLTKDEDEYDGGTILDPQNGKTYKCSLKLDPEDSDILQVRGYVAFFYKTQYWKRYK